MAAIDEMRKAGQWSDVALIIDAPPTVYSARATGALNTTDYSISYNSGSGTLANCQPDMTLLVGSSAGAADRGVLRLRKAPDASKFYIGIDKSFTIVNGDYLTVVASYELWAKHPKQSLIDVDVAYSNQHSAFRPTPFMGPPAVINAGGTVGFDASSSWAPGSSISAYAWASSPAATSSTGTNTATPTFTYNTPGRYLVSCALTAANGQAFTGYRVVHVIGDGYQAEANASFGDPTGQADGGWSFRVSMFARPTIRDRAMVVMFAKDYYDGQAASYGPVSGRENILCIGWIAGETIRRTPMQDTVEFEVLSTVAFLQRIAATSCGLQDTNLPEEDDQKYTPPAWSLVASLTGQKALHHLAHWRSTVSRVVDFYVEELGWAVPAVAVTENLGQQMATTASYTRLRLRSDRLGRLFAERDAQAVPIASRGSIPVQFALTDADWQGELTFVRRQVADTASVSLEGNIFYPNQHQLVQCGARSPGKPLRFGNEENESELVFPSQAVALELAGLAAGAASTEYDAIDATLFNNRLVDVCPRMYVQVTIDGKTIRTIPRRVTFRRDPNTGFMQTIVSLDQEGGQLPAVAIDYTEVDNPNEPPDPGDPPVDPPDPPDEPPDPPGDPGSNVAAIASTGSDVRTTADITVATPTWATEGPSASAIIDDYYRGGVYYALEADELWRSDNVSAGGAATWLSILDTSGFPDLSGLVFIRVVASLRYLWVLATATADGVESAIVFRSTTKGLTWSYSVIPGGLGTSKAYTVSLGNTSITRALGGGQVGADALMTRYDGSGSNDPWAMVFSFSRGDGEGIKVAWAYVQATYNLPHADALYMNQFGGSNIDPPDMPVVTWNENLSVGERTTLKGWLDDYFGGPENTAWKFITSEATAKGSMPKDPTKIYAGFVSGSGAGTASITAWAFFNKPQPSTPLAMDYAPTNPLWLYVGLLDRIYISRNGGATWELLVADKGANDIKCHPLLAGVITVWTPDGNLMQFSNGIPQGILLSEAADRTPRRIAYHPTNGGELIVATGGLLRKRVPVSGWTTIKSGLSTARGVITYARPSTGQYWVMAVDGSDIHVSTDSGATFAAKKGAWSFSGGIGVWLL